MLVNFYKLQNENFIKTICQLVEKAYETNYRVLIKTNDSQIEADINRILWTYSQKTFIPHGSSIDPLPNIQPVYISTGPENPNNANLKIFIDSFDVCEENFEKLLYIFSDNSLNTENSKKLYDKYIDNGLKVSYHIQETKGWSKL
jgi:DNA polymerase IIIc chi subunit